MLRNPLTLLLLLAAGSLHAGQVVKVGRDQASLAVTHDAARKWAVDEEVCIYQGGTQVACGRVLKTAAKGAIVRLETPSPTVVAGDTVRSKPGARRPATALLNSAEKIDVSGGSQVINLSAGLSVGLSFFFPMLNIQLALGRHVALGIAPIYFQASAAEASLKAFGGYGTLNYYGSDYFRGFWVQGGGGILAFTSNDGTTEEKANAPAFIGTIGWRGYWDLGLNIGVGAGVQYITNPNFAGTEIRSAGAQPLLILDVGMSF